MKFQLIRAQTQDALRIVALLDASLAGEFGPPLDADTDLVAAKTVWWLAYAGDSFTPVGFCGMTRPARDYELHFIRAGVLPTYRKQGLQKLMIRKRLAYAKKLGYRKVLTYVQGENIASARALLSCGFVPNKARHSKRDGLWLYVEAKT